MDSFQPFVEEVKVLDILLHGQRFTSLYKGDTSAMSLPDIFLFSE